ncbi:MAG: hypothetical protein JWP81_595 [Ferruginibacter sp.]|nr:hypothetical protein [Ferruginibacter sp.]
MNGTFLWCRVLVTANGLDSEYAEVIYFIIKHEKSERRYTKSYVSW